MLALGLLTLELHIENAQSLKDRRQVVRSLKDKLRTRLNVSVAEVDPQDMWQRATLAIAVVAGSRSAAEQTLERAEALANEQDGARCLRAEREML